MAVLAVKGSWPLGYWSEGEEHCGSRPPISGQQPRARRPSLEVCL